MHKKIVVVNRKCYRKNNKPIIDILKQKFGANVAFTDCSGHAEKIAEGSSGFDFIIAAGGDGTISEVVNGMDLESQSLAIIPLGTGNSLARDLGITSSRQIIDILEKDSSLAIDLIECRFEMRNKKFKRYVAATSGVGSVSITAILANSFLKSTGAFCYPAAATLAIFNQKVVKAKIQIDGFAAENVEFTNFIINNTRHSGNLCVFPKADFKDSALNLLFARNNALSQYLWNLGILTKTYFYNPGVKKLVSRLNIILDTPFSLMLDGEIFGPVNKITYSVAPRALKLLI